MPAIFNTGSTYGPLSKFFHWVVAALVILMLLFSYFLDDIPNKILKSLAFNAHKLTGLTILALMILRAAWALINTKPKVAGAKLWERWAERLVHWSLYLALFIMPIAGWVGSASEGRAPHYGKFTFNLPLEKNEGLSELCFSVHNTLAIIIIVLLVIHVLASLWHYFFKKDQVLQRMWP